jgi:hypothetical protein
VKVKTDSSGRFETEPFAVSHSTSIRIEGDVPLAGGALRHMDLYDESVELRQDDVHQVELDLYPLLVHARVLADTNGEPVSAATVSVWKQEEDRRGSSDGSATNAQGEVELLVLTPGEYTVNARADGFTAASTPVKVSAEGTSDVAVLRLLRAVPCAGHVRPDGAETERSGFSYLYVQSTENGPNTSGTQLQAPDYAFTLDGLPPGKYRAHLYMTGRRGNEIEFELGKEGNDHLEFVFTPREEK